MSHTWFADPTDVHLRHSVANLVACALGTCTRIKSSHLWYLIFAPEALRGTYLAGHMVGDLIFIRQSKPTIIGTKIFHLLVCTG